MRHILYEVGRGAAAGRGFFFLGARNGIAALAKEELEARIHGHRHELGGIKLALGLGAYFDFYAEIVARSPLWMRELRIEWVYRLLQEPRRLWKRFIRGNAVFFMHILASKLGLNIKKE